MSANHFTPTPLPRIFAIDAGKISKGKWTSTIPPFYHPIKISSGVTERIRGSWIIPGVWEEI
jgi:hypothetical protein